MRRRPAAAIDPADVVGLVTAVVSIDQRLALFRRRLERFAGDAASRPDGTGHGPAAQAPHSHISERAMPP